MTEKKTMEELSQGIRDICQSYICYDSKWKHIKTGNMYKVRGFTYNEADMNILVIYEPFNRHDYIGDVSFVRPVDEFLEKFERLSEYTVLLTLRELKELDKITGKK